ncbi:type III restriction enzyme res subunit (plasmid) [Nostoc sp. HK-01]|nr:type III restriction enzyme res subunit [Nostoc sp. HK-01]
MRSLLPKRNIPLTDADLASLEELLFNAEAVESRERFEEVYGNNLSLKLFIRQLVGLDSDLRYLTVSRKAACRETFLAFSTQS